MVRRRKVGLFLAFPGHEDERKTLRSRLRISLLPQLRIRAALRDMVALQEIHALE